MAEDPNRSALPIFLGGSQAQIERFFLVFNRIRRHVDGVVFRFASGKDGKGGREENKYGMLDFQHSYGNL